MCLIQSTLNCRKCEIPLAKTEIIRKTEKETNIHSNSALAIKIKDNNIVRCKLCDELVGIKLNDTITLFDEKIFILEVKITCE